MNHALDEGKHFKTVCTLESGSLPVHFTWLMNNKIINQNEDAFKMKTTNSDDMSILSISNVQHQHAGNYTCRVQNQFGIDSYTIQLNVHVPIKWVTEPQNVTVKLGDKLELFCDAEGVPTPMTSWKKISNHYHHQQQYKQSFSEEKNGKLIKFKRIQLSDSGQYECLIIHQSNHLHQKTLRKMIWVKILGKKFNSIY